MQHKIEVTHVNFLENNLMRDICKFFKIIMANNNRLISLPTKELHYRT